MKLSFLLENIRIAFDAIKGQLLRTILTVVIIAIGITALVGILSAVGALENTISGNFSSMGSNTFNIQQYEFTSKRRGHSKREKINPVISYRDVRLFNDQYRYPFTQTALSFTGTQNAEIKYEHKKTDPEVRVLGVNEHFLENSGLNLDLGRNFTRADIDNTSKTCIIGSDFSKNLFQNTSPINKIVSIRGVKFKVIGVLESKGASFGNNLDLRIFIPLQVARSLFTLPNINYKISIKVSDKAMMLGALDQAIATFRNVRKLNPMEAHNFGIERSDDLINRIAKISSYLYIAAWIISIITIFGSSIALMNIMLVSVTERTREIGVRKALGAKRGTIAAQFFIETLIIGQLGGILGIIFGVLIGFLVSKAANFSFETPWTAILWATAITFIVAIISGSYPASKAAKQDPIASLRYE